MDKPKQRFASSISPSANRSFSSFFVKKKKLAKGPQSESKVTLLFSLTYSVDFVMLSPHIWPAFSTTNSSFFYTCQSR